MMIMFGKEHTLAVARTGSPSTAQVQPIPTAFKKPRRVISYALISSPSYKTTIHSPEIILSIIKIINQTVRRNGGCAVIMGAYGIVGYVLDRMDAFRKTLRRRDVVAIEATVNTTWFIEKFRTWVPKVIVVDLNHGISVETSYDAHEATKR